MVRPPVLLTMKSLTNRLFLLGVLAALPFTLFAGTSETVTLDVKNMTCSICPITVKKALEKKPQQRYASPSELAEDIERYLKGEQVLAGPQRLRKPLVIAAGALLLIPAAWFVNRTFTFHPAPKITSTIVLSDLTNDTGDPFFDRAFRQTISFELQRSVFENAFGRKDCGKPA